MSDKRPWSVKGILLTALVVAGLSVYAGCGNVGSSDMPVTSIPSSAIVSFEATGPRGTTSSSEGSENLVVRGNSRDLLEVIANVTGLTKQVGFFIPLNWGVWQGGTLSAVDAFTYYAVNEVGEARGVLVVGANAGRQDIIARYQDWDTGQYMEARLSITFDLSTMSIFPSTIVFNNDPFVRHVLEARGALPPVEWWVSHPDIMAFHTRDDTSIYLYWNNAMGPIATDTLPAGGGMVTARDAEGQEDTTVVYMINTACSTGTLGLSPSSGPLGSTVSVIVTDLDLIGALSITVQTQFGLTLNGATTITLTSAGNDGIFEGLFSVTAPATGEGAVIYRDENDAANTCLPTIVTTVYTVTN